MSENLLYEITSMKKPIQCRCVFNSFAHDFEIYLKEQEIKVKQGFGLRMEVYHYTPYNMPRGEINRQNKELGIAGINYLENTNGK